MAKLYISEETLNRLSNSKELQGYSAVLNGFDIKNSKTQQFKKPKSRPIVKEIKEESQRETPANPSSISQSGAQKELTQDEKIEIALQQMKESLAQTRNFYHYSTHKIKPKNRKKKNKNRNNPQISSLQVPKKPKIKTLKIKKQQNKTTPTSKAFSIDYNNLIDDYESREIEFGHGRAKSKEWNDEIAKSFQRELKERRKNPDWTDRFALK